MTETRQNCGLERNRCQPRNQVEATYCVARHGHLDAQAIAARCRIPYERFIKLTSSTNAYPLLPLALVPTITAITRDTRIVEHIARDCGGVFIQLPHIDASHDDAFTALASIASEVGDCAQTMQRILHDKKVTADESAEYDRQADEAIARILESKALVARKAGVTKFPVAVEPISVAR